MLDILQDYMDYRGDVSWLLLFRLNSSDSSMKSNLGFGDVTEESSKRKVLRTKERWKVRRGVCDTRIDSRVETCGQK